MAAYLFPPGWLTPAMKERVIEFLRNLPIAPYDKKIAYIDWAKAAGVRITAKDIERVTGRKAGSI